MDFSDIALLLVAGGKSSRMGQDKRWAALGDTALLARLAQKADRIPFAERLLCVERETPALLRLAGQHGMRLVCDERQEAGPMEGLRRGLSAMGTDWGLAVSCDMPFFAFEAACDLLSAAQESPAARAVLPVQGRRWQPLAALYHRGLAAVFLAALARGERKIRAAASGAAHVLVPFDEARESLFFNVNTPADLRLAAGRIANEGRRVPLVTVSAPQSGTGKTTFIERVLPILAAAGIRAGVVKGDAHGYHLDRKGKDSDRFRTAGARATAVVSPSGYFIEQRTETRESLAAVAARLKDVDLVLIESRNHGTAPILSLFRGKGEPIVTDEVAAAFAKSERQIPMEGVRVFDLDDREAAARTIRFLACR